MALLNSILNWFNPDSTHTHPGPEEAERIWQQYPVAYRNKRDVAMSLDYRLEKLSEEERRTHKAMTAEKVLSFISAELVVIDKAEWAEEERLQELQRLTKKPTKQRSYRRSEDEHEEMAMVNHTVLQNAIRDIHTEETKIREAYTILKHLHDILVAQIHYIALIKKKDDRYMEYAKQLHHLVFRDEGMVMAELESIYTVQDGVRARPEAAEKIIEAIIHGEKLVPEHVTEEELYRRNQKTLQAQKAALEEKQRRETQELQSKIDERNALRREESTEEALLRRIYERKDPYNLAMEVYHDALALVRMDANNPSAHEAVEVIMQNEKKLASLIRKRKPNLSEENVIYLAHVIGLAFDKFYLY